MEIERISRWRYVSTIVWAVAGSIAVVAVTAGLARATLNMKGALVEKPEIAVYILLPDLEITQVEIIREEEAEKDLLVHTKNGNYLVIMKKGEEQWYVAEKEKLHE